MEIIISAFRGEPVLFQAVYDMLQGTTGAYRSHAPNQDGTSTSRGAAPRSRQTRQEQHKSTKRNWNSGGHDEADDNPMPRPTKRGNCDITKATVRKLKFACPFHKHDPGKYCVHQQLNSSGTFYRPCAETGWGRIKNLM